MAKDQHGWYSPEEKMYYIEEYFNSGLSLTKFCDSRDIERYLEYILNNINKIKIDDILPWSKKLPKELKLNLK